MELETSLREVIRIVTKPEFFQHVAFVDYPQDYMPNPKSINFKVGKGLVIYEPFGEIVEMSSALTSDDLPEKPISVMREQWNYLKSLGFKQVNAYPSRFRARYFCRCGGMEKINDSFYKVRLDG